MSALADSWRYPHADQSIWQDIKPDAPTVPFWYCIRLLEKRH